MKDNHQTSSTCYFNPRVNDASFFESKPSKPGILLPYASWADFYTQMSAPILVILNGIEEVIRQPIVFVLSLFNAGIYYALDDQSQAFEQLMHAFQAMITLFHLIPFSVICDLLITTVCCFTRPLANLLSPILPQPEQAIKNQATA